MDRPDRTNGCLREDGGVLGDDAGGVSRRVLLLGGVGALAAAAGAGYAVERDSPTLRRLLGGCGSTPSLPPDTYTQTAGSLDSTAMRRAIPWVIALPPGHRPGDGTPLVLCLHGRTGSADDLTRAIGLPAWASHSGVKLAFVAPSVGGADYWHPRASGIDPLAMAVEELLPLVEHRFGVGGARDRRGMLGWSMGGFGALLAAQQHPDTFAAAVGASPAVFPSYADARRGHSDTFDSEQQWETYGLWRRLDDLRAVAVRLDCGDADPFESTVRTMLRRLPGAAGGISAGCHDDAFWRRVATREIDFLAGQLSG